MPAAAAARPLPKSSPQLELWSWLIKLRTRDLLTIGEVADITRLSRQSISLLMDEGRLEGFGFRIGGKSEKQRRVSVESLCRYLLTSANVSDEDRADLLLTWVDKLDLRSIDFLLPHLTRRRERLAAQR